jgi:hypothetical protein
MMEAMGYVAPVPMVVLVVEVGVALSHLRLVDYIMVIQQRVYIMTQTECPARQVLDIIILVSLLQRRILIQEMAMFRSLGNAKYNKIG